MYCYKPTMDKTCCPQYTIRCDTSQVKLTKSQKKVLKHVNKCLNLDLDGQRERCAASSVKDDGVQEADDEPCDIGSEPLNEPELGEVGNLANLPIVKEPCVNVEIKDVDCSKDTSTVEITAESPSGDYDNCVLGVSGNSSKQDDTVRKSVMGPDPNKPKCMKAKDIRREKKMLKMNQHPNTDPSTSGKITTEIEKSLEDYIDGIGSTTQNKLEFNLVNVKDKELFETTFDEEFSLYRKYQHIVHGDDKDELTERQFRRFLVDGPLHYVPPVGNCNDIPSTGLGAFHHQYRIDGKLVAVGVIDILPHCVSSKYFFYDPDYRFLSLGTYSALREIHLVRSLNKDCPNLKYYYMGFYIHTCHKMKYKAKYRPSFLLCPETFIWQPVENCIPKFVESKYARLEDDASKKAPPAPELNSVLILNNMQAMTFQKYVKNMSSKSRQAAQVKEVSQYSVLVGSACNKILLYRS